MRTDVASLSLLVAATACCGPSPVSAFLAPASTTRFAGTTASLSGVHRHATSTSFPPRMAATGGDGSEKKTAVGPWEAFTTDLAKKFAVAATIAALGLSGPGDALAAKSGGRVGGRSFSSPSVSDRFHYRDRYR